MSRLRSNRVELAKLRRRRALIRRGVDLLTRKKEALMEDFTGSLRHAHESRRGVEETLERAVRALAAALSAEPSDEVMSAALTSESALSIEIATERKWGALLPELVWFNPHRSPLRRGSAPGTRSPTVDEAAARFEVALEAMAKAGVAEARAMTLGRAYRKTSRMLNMLETVVRPQVESDIALIVSRLEEREREEQFRMKRFKRLRGAAGGSAPSTQ